MNTTTQQEVESIKKYHSKEHIVFFLKRALNNQKKNHAKIDTVAKWNREVEIYTLALKEVLN